MRQEGRRIAEGGQVQGADEVVVYSLTTTNWGHDPDNIVVKAYHINNDYADVSEKVLVGVASVAGDVITLPAIKDLIEGSRYRIEVKFTVSGNVLETYFIIEAER